MESLSLIHLSQAGNNLTTIRVSEDQAEDLQKFLLNRRLVPQLISPEERKAGETVVKNSIGAELSRRIIIDIAIEFLEPDLQEWEASLN